MHTAEIHIPVKGKLDEHTVLQLADPLVSPHPALHGSIEVVLDLRGVRFITPFSIVVLVTLLRSDAARVKTVRLICPERADCLHYLAFSGFLHHATPCVEFVGEHDLRDAEPSWGATTVLPLTCLAESAQIPNVIRRIEARLDEMMGTSGEAWHKVKRSICSTVRELCMNVFDHADCNMGWIAAQRYVNRYNGRPFIELAIGDAGCGIRRSLATRHEDLALVSDSEAMHRMLKENLTRKAPAHHGTGYYILQHATKRLDGSFSLRSGTGIVSRPRRRSLFELEDGLPPWPGMQLLARLTCA